MSSLARRRRTSLLGSRRWWQGGCWATRSHQEAYLRKLYGRRSEHQEDKTIPGEEDAGRREVAPWAQTTVYDLPSGDEHYLDAFLRNRGDEEDIDVCPLATARASPTEKCVEFLNGARGPSGTNASTPDVPASNIKTTTSISTINVSTIVNNSETESNRVTDCGPMHSDYDVVLDSVE